MREISQQEIASVSGGGEFLNAIGLGGGDSGYAALALNYGRGIAVVGGLAAFGIPGAIGAGAAFSAGWAIGGMYNYFSGSSGGGGGGAGSPLMLKHLL
jgi:hypothetical protein